MLGFLFADNPKTKLGRIAGPRRAVTVTTVFDGADSFIADVEATADADTTATIPHTLGVAPAEVTLTPLAAAARLSLWIAGTIDANNVVCLKATTAGSGAAGNQLRAIIRRPHSIGR
jgi:hypothetical protein